MSDLKLDTYQLRTYATRIDNANARISRLDLRIKTLYGQVGLKDLLPLIQTDLLITYSKRLVKCRNYLNAEASRFDNNETYLLKFDPAKFVTPNPRKNNDWLKQFGNAVKKSVNGIRKAVDTTAALASGVIGKVGCAVKKAVGTVKSAVDHAVQTAKDAVKTVGNAVKTGAARVKSFVKDAASRVAAGAAVIGNAVKQGAENVKSFVKTLATKAAVSAITVGNAVKTCAEKTYNFFKNSIETIKYSYESKGIVYKTVQIGKGVVTTVKGVAKVVAAGVSLFGSGGLSTPVSVLAGISGANDCFNGVRNIYHSITGEYDKLEENFLKDTLAEGGGIIGEWLGNKQIGETFGKVTYFGVDLVTSLATLELGLDKIKQLPSVNLGKVGAELKEIMSLDVSHIFTTDLSTLFYEAKLASYAFAETTKAIAVGSALCEVFDKSLEIGKSIDSIITVNIEDWENPVVNVLDSVNDVFGYIGNAVKYGKKAAQKFGL